MQIWMKKAKVYEKSEGEQKVKTCSGYCNGVHIKRIAQEGYLEINEVAE